MFVSNTSITSVGWRYGIFAGLCLAIFALYPQLLLWYSVGDKWVGNYAINDIDEPAYAGYLAALIEGRPRKNDPYTGHDQSIDTPQPESLFSIQFASPYIVAIPSRLLGISASWAMILAGGFAGFFSALLLYFLILALNGNQRFAMAGSLIVLCGGALFAGEGAIGELLGKGTAYPYFPFLRRYIPAVPFPFLIFFFGAIYQLLRAQEWRSIWIWWAAAFTSFSFLVFSYFYLWTPAFAFIVCIFGLILIFRVGEWKTQLRNLALLGATLLVPLGIYSYLLSKRAETMDNVQLLVSTHLPDLFRVPEYVSVVALLLLLIAYFWRKSEVDTAFLLTLAVVITPFLLFNQQVLTGLSLQPIHYQVFVGNYLAGFGLVLSIGILAKGFESSRSFVAGVAIFATLAVFWGFVECHFTVNVLADANIVRDDSKLVGDFLTKEAENSPTPYQDSIISVGTLHSDDSPTTAPQAVLWARHQHVFAGLNWQENKERYYLYMYFLDLSPRWLENQLLRKNFVSVITLFGWGRHSTRLTAKAKPITKQEISAEVEAYADFIENLTEDRVYSPMLTHYVVSDKNKIRFINIDKWYERDGGRKLGTWNVYRLKPIKIQ